MTAGDDFIASIEDHLRRAAVLLVLVAKDWLHVHDKFGRRRLDSHNDWVRREIRHALANNNCRVIPVLIDDAELPDDRAALPEDIGDLLTRQRVLVRQTHSDDDTEALCRELEKAGFSRLDSDRELLGRREFSDKEVQEVVAQLRTLQARRGTKPFAARELLNELDLLFNRKTFRFEALRGCPEQRWADRLDSSYQTLAVLRGLHAPYPGNRRRQVLNLPRSDKGGRHLLHANGLAAFRSSRRLQQGRGTYRREYVQSTTAAGDPLSCRAGQNAGDPGSDQRRDRTTPLARGRIDGRAGEAVEWSNSIPGQASVSTRARAIDARSCRHPAFLGRRSYKRKKRYDTHGRPYRATGHAGPPFIGRVLPAQKLRLHPKLGNPTVLIVVDRIDLDTQITATFNATDVPNMVGVAARQELQRLLAEDVRKVLIRDWHSTSEGERLVQKGRTKAKPKGQPKGERRHNYACGDRPSKCR